MEGFLPRGPYDYGDEVTPPKIAVYLKDKKSCLYEEDGWPIAAKQVKESELDHFLSSVSEQDARILPVTCGRSGKRYKSWSELADTCKEADLEDWPLAGVRTVSWCVDLFAEDGTDDRVSSRRLPAPVQSRTELMGRPVALASYKLPEVLR